MPPGGRHAAPSRLAALLFAAPLAVLTPACGDTGGDGGDGGDTGAETGGGDTGGGDTGGGDTGGGDTGGEDTGGGDTGAPTCEDECPAAAETSCDPGGTASVVTCADYDGDGCLEWGGDVDCLGGTACVDGFCTVSCEQACSVKGARKCDGADAYTTCADPDFDGCLDWGATTECPEGEVCSSGFCASDCSDECSVIGATHCNGDAVESCGDSDADPCLEWRTADPCGQGEACADGYCTTECSDECTVVGAKACDGDAAKVCGDANQDPCLEWGTADPCGPGESCSNGFCATGCTDACTVLGAKACDGAGVTACGDHDGDSTRSCTATRRRTRCARSSSRSSSSPGSSTRRATSGASSRTWRTASRSSRWAPSTSRTSRAWRSGGRGRSRAAHRHELRAPVSARVATSSGLVYDAVR